MHLLHTGGGQKMEPFFAENKRTSQCMRHMFNFRIVGSSCTFAIMPFASGLKPLLLPYKSVQKLGGKAPSDCKGF